MVRMVCPLQSPGVSSRVVTHRSGKNSVSSHIGSDRREGRRKDALRPENVDLPGRVSKLGRQLGGPRVGIFAGMGYSSRVHVRAHALVQQHLTLGTPLFRMHILPTTGGPQGRTEKTGM
eukprot:10198410-Karenia_brevis.AAC.1